MKELELGSAVVCEVCLSYTTASAGIVVRHFELTLDSKEVHAVSLCKECAESYALALLRAWSPTIQRNMRRGGKA